MKGLVVLFWENAGNSAPAARAIACSSTRPWAELGARENPAMMEEDHDGLAQPAHLYKVFTARQTP
jgi:hypothetical protein